MMLRKKYLIFGLLLSFWCVSCGIKFQESSFRYRIDDLNELSTAADETIKQEIEGKKATFLEAYKNLPTEEKARSKALGKLNETMRKTINEIEDKIDVAKELREEAAKAATRKELQKFVGVWKGVGMDLTITEDGTIEYKRLKGGITKSFSGGKIFQITPDSLKVKVLLSKTIFRIDKPPHEEDGKRKMTIDGVELTRVY